jgi:hypothetical protein
VEAGEAGKDLKIKNRMKLSVITITPEIAARFLAVNLGNRQLRRGNVAYWRSAIIGNAVSLTHQGIAIAGTIEDPIRLIDGQHRLAAIVETGISVDFVVCENAPLESFKNLDNGMVRSLGDRAGLTASEAQMANALYYYAQAGSTAKPPVKLIQEINEIINPYASLVAHRKHRSLSLVAIRAAFVMQQKKYGTNHSVEFQNGEFGALTDSLNALYRRQSINPLGIGGGSAAFLVFCSTWRAICRPSLSRVYISGAPSEEASEIIRSVIPEVFDAIAKYR